MARSMRPWDGVAFDYPARVPTMISGEERRYLFWLASQVWKGKGNIVEMGPWLGGSTVCLAAGMRRSVGGQPWKLHVFDSFIWRQFMEDRHPLDIEIGESFQPFFENNVRDYSDLLKVTRAMLPDDRVALDSFPMTLRDEVGDCDMVSWADAEPIEILFVDAAKSWSSFRELLRTFGPSMIVGESLLVLQDFKYWGSFSVPVITEILHSCLQLEHNLRQNIVAFRVVAPLDAKALEAVPEWEEIDVRETEGLIERAAERLERLDDSTGAAVVRLSRVRMWLHRGDVGRAVECFKESERGWPATGPDVNLSTVRQRIREETGVAIPMTLRSRIRKRINGLRSAVLRAARQMKRSVS